MTTPLSWGILSAALVDICAVKHMLRTNQGCVQIKAVYNNHFIEVGVLHQKSLLTQYATQNAAA